MSRKKKTSFKQYAYFLLPLVILSVYVSLAWAIRLDLVQSVSSIEFFGIDAPHSGQYYSIAARRLEYLPHRPEEVEQLFADAIVHSPADAGIFFDTFRHYRERNCCEDRASKLLEEGLKRSPASLKVYPEAAAYFVKIGQIDKAIEYLKMGTTREPGLINDMFPILVKAKLTPQQIVQTVVRNEQGLTVLAAYLARLGVSQKDEWLRTVRELHSLEVNPKLLLITAEQALKLKDFEEARKYAEMAQNHSETKKGADRMLQKIARAYQATMRR